MSKQKIIIGLVAVLIVVAAFVGLSAWQSRQSLEEYNSYRQTTKNDLSSRHQALTESWDIEDKPAEELQPLLSDIQLQIDYANERGKSLPTPPKGLLKTGTDVNRPETIQRLDTVAIRYQELHDRVEVERGSRAITKRYEESARTMDDYRRAMRDLSKIAQVQSEKEYANQTDKQLAEQYGIIVQALANAEAAEGHGDRSAYDAANQKVDEADQKIRSTSGAIDTHFGDILSEIGRLINQL